MFSDGPATCIYFTCCPLADIHISEEFLTGAQSLFLFNSISAATDTGRY
jgi:hypothetical protein